MNCCRRRLIATLVLSMGFWSARAAAQVPAAAAPAGPAGNGAGGAGAAAAAAAKPAPVASPPAPVTIPPAVYTSPTPAAISAFIAPNIANLMNDGDPAGQAKSRDNLTAAVFTAGAPASPAFLLVYAQALDAAVAPNLAPAKKATLRQRLNLAIVVARVATVAQNGALAPSTTLLLNDPAEPVVLWGLKAATPQVRQALTVKIGKKLPPMVAAIVPAALKHPSGPIIEEAYTALWSSDPDVIAELMQLWGFRLAQYQQQAPDELFYPVADGKPVFWLTTADIWRTLAPAMQVKVMQNISDQASVAAQWADQTQAGDKRDQLIKVMQQCAGGALVVGQNTPGSDALVKAATPPAHVEVTRLPPGTKVLPMVDPVLTDAIQGAFKGVKPPPKVGQNAGGAGVAGP
jgi:hypothetical protein